MGDPRGFIKHERKTWDYRAPRERISDWNEQVIPLEDEKIRKQGSRCMDCGVPFCMSGCPLGNLIPDFNDLVYRGKNSDALKKLHATNNFPEFTGRICPAPCENACVLGIIEPAVTIKQMEYTIIEKAFENDEIYPVVPESRTGKSVAIVGAGPSGLACAQQLNRAGHSVTVFEKSPKAGGLMQWGIPAYKLRKEIIQRRVDILEAEGIVFKYNSDIGTEITWKNLSTTFDAVVACIGAEQPRDLKASGRDAKGVHFAMEFLPKNISKIYHEKSWNGGEDISAKGKNVIVIGGGDTGSDCIGTSLRQGAKSVTNFELMDKPPANRRESNPWPQYARIYRVSTSVEENNAKGGKTEYNIATNRFIKDDSGNLTGIETVEVEWISPDGGGQPKLNEIEGSEKIWDCDLALLAMGFLGPMTESIVKELDVMLDMRGNIKTDKMTKMTSTKGFFAAGDCRRGQSLVVWAIAEGREVASHVDRFLLDGPSQLPRVRLTPYKY